MDYVQEEPTGRRVFRRIYPAALRPFLTEPKGVLKVPLGASRFLNADAFRAYDRAKRQFEAEVKAARAVQRRHLNEREGRRDALSHDRVAYMKRMTLPHLTVHSEARAAPPPLP